MSNTLKLCANFEDCDYNIKCRVLLLVARLEFLRNKGDLVYHKGLHSNLVINGLSGSSTSFLTPTIEFAQLHIDDCTGKSDTLGTPEIQIEKKIGFGLDRLEKAMDLSSNL
jgi:hypothetical protein